MKMTVFWDIVPCSLVEVDRHLRGVYWLHVKLDRKYATAYFFTVAKII
jgi:hypothetical protein